MERSVTLSRRGAERLAHGHPWIYRGDVERAPEGLESGDVVAAKDGRGRFLGKAFWSARSRIALRFVTLLDEAVDDDFLAARLASAVALRQLVLPGEPSAPDRPR